jgi:hypothetical protein
MKDPDSSFGNTSKLFLCTEPGVAFHNCPVNENYISIIEPVPVQAEQTPSEKTLRRDCALIVYKTFQLADTQESKIVFAHLCKSAKTISQVNSQGQCLTPL